MKNIILLVFLLWTIACGGNVERNHGDSPDLVTPNGGSAMEDPIVEAPVDHAGSSSIPMGGSGGVAGTGGDTSSVKLLVAHDSSEQAEVWPGSDDAEVFHFTLEATRVPVIVNAITITLACERGDVYARTGEAHFSDVRVKDVGGSDMAMDPAPLPPRPYAQRKTLPFVLNQQIVLSPGEKKHLVVTIDVTSTEEGLNDLRDRSCSVTFHGLAEDSAVVDAQTHVALTAPEIDTAATIIGRPFVLGKRKLLVHLADNTPESQVVTTAKQPMDQYLFSHYIVFNDDSAPLTVDTVSVGQMSDLGTLADFVEVRLQVCDAQGIGIGSVMSKYAPGAYRDHPAIDASVHFAHGDHLQFNLAESGITHVIPPKGALHYCLYGLMSTVRQDADGMVEGERVATRGDQPNLVILSLRTMDKLSAIVRTSTPPTMVLE